MKEVKTQVTRKELTFTIKQEVNRRQTTLQTTGRCKLRKQTQGLRTFETWYRYFCFRVMLKS